ncbi:MAG: site-2 protease family protein [Candidatus Diapherotrites archaeon]|nr:site-2 protease family protein [Candidatus Diapherotrites archaeon]
MKRSELQDLIISWLTISIAFTRIGRLVDMGSFLYLFPMSLVAVGTGFIAHELAHRAVARRYGCHAEFVMWPAGLVIALISSLMNFIFAAPGAVYVYGPHLTKKQNAKISLAGPLMNTAIGLLFIFIFFFIIGNRQTYIGELIFGVATLNLWFATFNLIPFPPLDGSKILAHFPSIWLLLLLGNLAILGLSGFF